MSSLPKKRGAEDVGTYLEQFLENAGSLPAEISRNFTLMKELDIKARDIQQRLDKDHKFFMANKAQKTGPEVQAFADQIKAEQQHCQTICDEKISLAMQTYERVESYIRQLDADLKKFEDEIKSDPSYAASSSSSNNTISITKAEKKEPPTNKKKQPEVSAPTTAHTRNVDLDLAIDPNEPVYCICKQVSFGDMIACDNPDCSIEWFHFQCVGLTSVKGSWYCPDCKAKIRQGMLKLP